MALTGQIETPDGILHNEAYGFVYPLIISIYPNPIARFEFHFWHNKTAFENGKAEIKSETFQIEGQELLGFMVMAEENIKNGMSLISATVLTMQSFVKQNPLFQDWIAI